MRAADIKFHVIFDVDSVASFNVDKLRPTAAAGRWAETEDDGSFDYEHLGGDWVGGRHRKWVCEDLTVDEFTDFVRDAYLRAEACETGGAMTGHGWLPAISFNADDDDGEWFAGAYVTPYVEGVTLDDDDWDKLSSVIQETWGRRGSGHFEDNLLDVYPVGKRYTFN